MNTMMKKAISDIRLYPGRFSLVIVALVVGVWGVGSILVSYYVLSQDLRQNYLNTRPAHAILTSRDFDNLDMDAFQARPEVEAAEFRDYSVHRIEVTPNNWIPLWLYGVADFKNMRLARIESERGRAVPEPGTILVERDGLRISNFKTVTDPRVRLPQGVVRVPVSGISFDPAQAPATQDHFIYAYTDQNTYAQLTGEAINQRLIVRLNKVSNKIEVRDIIEKLIREFSAHNIHVNKVLIPQFNQHPHQWQLDTLMLLQGSISLLAFAMAAVLVSQLMASMLARQIRQIGVLKAIGASRAQVLGIYSTTVLVLGVAASLVGVPLAVASGYGFSYFVAYQLNFDILTTDLPLAVYLAIITVSILLPLILSLSTILKGTRISVREALSDYGINANTPSTKSTAKKWSALPNNLVMALRNVMRRKKRLALTLLTMALGVAMFSTGFNVRQSLATLLQEAGDSMRYDVRVTLKQPITDQQSRVLFGTLSNVRTIEGWNYVIGQVGGSGMPERKEFRLTALPAKSELLKPALVQGHWLKSGKEAEVVMNMRAWNLYGSPPLGSRQVVALKDMQVELTLVGLTEEFAPPTVYMEQKQYNNLFNPGQRINSMMFAAVNKDYEEVVVLKQEIEELLAGTGMPVKEVVSHAEDMRIIYDHLNIVLMVIIFFAFTVLLVSALGMASAMGIAIMERTREIGVLRAIGATPSKVFRMFETEGMLISIASIFLGLLLSWPLSTAATEFFGDLMLGGAKLKFVVSQSGLWITLITTVVFGVFASRIPARNAIRVSTQRALVYE